MTLADLIAPAKLRRAGEADLPILSMTMRGGLVDQADKFKKRIASADTAPYKRVLRGQLVVGFPIDEGVLSFQSLYDEAIVSPAYDVWDVRQPEIVDPRFLERVLRSPRALAFYRSKLQGTTARRRTLPDDIFLSLPVRLPDLRGQSDAISILDKTASLLRKRQEAIRLADEFLRAVFFDMFGSLDSLSNSPVSLGEVVEIDAPMVDPVREEFADLLHVGPDRIEKNTGQLLECLTAREEGLISKKFLFDESYVLYSKIRPYLRKCALATFRGLCSADMYPVRPREGRVTREFIWGLLLSDRFDQYILTLPDRANIPKLNRVELNAFQFRLPPVALQNKYSAIVAKTHVLKAKHQEFLREADALPLALSFFN